MAPRTQFELEIDSVRAGLVEMASRVLTQVERAVAAWEDTDAGAAAQVIADDDYVDDLCADLDNRIYQLQLLQAPVAGDQRLLHVGLIAAIALERVGDLAVAIAQLASSVPHAPVPELQSLISRMSARSVDCLARAVHAIARSDVELADGAVKDAQQVPGMLDDLVAAAGSVSLEPETRAWTAAAVLVGRHLERVANNGRELGGRVRFLVEGEPFRRGERARA